MLKITLQHKMDTDLIFKLTDEVPGKEEIKDKDVGNWGLDYYTVKDNEDKIIAFCMVGYLEEYKHNRIFAFQVHKDYRRKKVGTFLLREIVKTFACRYTPLTLTSTSNNMLQLALNCNFEVIGKIDDEFLLQLRDSI